MVQYNEVVGHEDEIQFLKNSIAAGKVSHSYILTGEAGVGKKMLATTFAAALQCEKGGPEPCMSCDSCKKAVGSNHPDIITVHHEKPNVITADEVRTQIVNDVVIRPYKGPYKVYLVPDAQMMGETAQNILLKTIEEPPAYAVILLLTTSIDALLPTIQSRCVRLDIKLVDEKKIKEYLTAHLGLTDEEADLDAALAQGSIGKACEAAVSEDFKEMTHSVVQILRTVDERREYEMADMVRLLSADRQKALEYLEIFQFWFRDVLMFKATREIDHLVFKQEINYIREQARERSYENLEKINECLEKTRVRIQANANAQIAIELLFLTIRER